MSSSPETSGCALCRRRVPLTFHHLIPRKTHRRARFKKRYSKRQLADGVDLCRLCHSGLHGLYDEMTLATRFNTLSLLQADPAISRHVRWVSKQRIANDE